MRSEQRPDFREDIRKVGGAYAQVRQARPVVPESEGGAASLEVSLLDFPGHDQRRIGVRAARSADKQFDVSGDDTRDSVERRFVRMISLRGGPICKPQDTSGCNVGGSVSFLTIGAYGS